MIAHAMALDFDLCPERDKFGMDGVNSFNAVSRTQALMNIRNHLISSHHSTPLHYDASSGSIDMATLLLAHGAQESVNVKGYVSMYL